MGTLKFDALYSLFKSEPGLRKSTCALSYPTPQYWFSYDKKMNALRIPMKNWGINPSEIEFDDYSNWDHARAFLEKLQVNCKYKTIIVDTITSCADSINRQTLGQKAATGGGKKIGTISVNSIEDYNAEDQALKELVALTKDICIFHKVNIILIGHIVQKEIKGPNNTTHMARLLVTAGKGIAQKIPGYCDETYHFNIDANMDASKEGDYTLRTRHTGDDFARTSLPLESKIIFNDKPLYTGWIKPALMKMQGSELDDKAQGLIK